MEVSSASNTLNTESHASASSVPLASQAYLDKHTPSPSMTQLAHIVAKGIDKSDIGSQDMSHLHGAKIYSQRGLELYDPIVHGFMSPYAWRCEATKLCSFFNRNVDRANRAAVRGGHAPQVSK